MCRDIAIIEHKAFLKRISEKKSEAVSNSLWSWGWPWTSLILLLLLHKCWNDWQAPLGLLHVMLKIGYRFSLILCKYSTAQLYLENLMGSHQIFRGCINRTQPGSLTMISDFLNKGRHLSVVLKKHCLWNFALVS